jgi:hypothetical protein
VDDTPTWHDFLPFLDFENRREKTVSPMFWLPTARRTFPPTRRA